MYKIFTLVFITATLLQAQQWKTNTFSAKYTEDPYWTAKSKYENSYYKGNIVAKRKVSALKGAGFPGLVTYMKKWFEGQATNKTWKVVKNYFTVKRNGKEVKIDAITINYTNVDKSDTGMIKMNLNAYIGHDPGNVLIIESVSAKVFESTGDKKRLKSFRSFYRYHKDTEPGYYSVYCWRFYQVEGYWYEPTGIFVKSVRKKTLKSFDDAIERWSKVWAENL